MEQGEYELELEINKSLNYKEYKNMKKYQGII